MFCATAASRSITLFAGTGVANSRYARRPVARNRLHVRAGQGRVPEATTLSHNNPRSCSRVAPGPRPLGVASGVARCTLHEAPQVVHACSCSLLRHSLERVRLHEALRAPRAAARQPHACEAGHAVEHVLHAAVVPPAVDHQRAAQPHRQRAGQQAALGLGDLSMGRRSASMDKGVGTGRVGVEQQGWCGNGTPYGKRGGAVGWRLGALRVKRCVRQNKIGKTVVFFLC